ncbi:MAG TPA: hypothetical protein VME17_25885 [Bryobacteraceae bacterium]|nr:hypothetical protein [Bryobacteraceae bacterium]
MNCTKNLEEAKKKLAESLTKLPKSECDLTLRGFINEPRLVNLAKALDATAGRSPEEWTRAAKALREYWAEHQKKILQVVEKDPARKQAFLRFWAMIEPKM